MAERLTRLCDSTGQPAAWHVLQALTAYLDERLSDLTAGAISPPAGESGPPEVAPPDASAVPGLDAAPDPEDAASLWDLFDIFTES